jgi:hypothetical protein
MTKTFTIAALALAVTAASSVAQAGDNRCLGVITASWQPLLRVVDDQGEAVCRFDDRSKVGKQILSKCPVGTKCEIELSVIPLSTPLSPHLITKVIRVERWEYSAMPAAAPPAPPPLTATAPPRSPALAKDKVRAVTPAATFADQPTGKWCEIIEQVDNDPLNIWQLYKRGNCKTGDDESGWIEFFSGGYRERDTICKMTNERRGKNWLLYHCLVETEFTEDRIHKWGIDPKTRVLSWGTLDAADEDEAKN